MFIIIKFKHLVAPFALGLLTILFATSEANAAEVTVKTEDELRDLLDQLTENTKIIIDPTYHSDGGDGLNVNVDTVFDVEIDVNNVNFVGNSTINDDSTGKLVIKNYLIDTSNGSSTSETPQLNIHVSEPKGRLILQDSTFQNTQRTNGGIITFDGQGGLIEVENVLLDKNKTVQLGGGINVLSSSLNVAIKNSTFTNNITIEGGAAIHNEYGYENMEILNSKFINNYSYLVGSSLNNGAGAIYTEEGSEKSHMTIKDSYFHNNSVDTESDTHIPNAGAITFSRFKEQDSISISGTTFSKNEGSGGGGAIVINESEPSAANLKLENNTFYKNSAKSDFNLSTGGAILINNSTNDEENTESTNTLYSRNNTFIENEIIRDDMQEAPEDVKGGAIGMIGNFMKHEFLNDLLVGNEVGNNKTPSKLFLNMYIPSTNYIEKNTIGFDNGTETKDTVEQAYGKYPVVLAENGSTIKAGTNKDASIIPTVMIAPKLTKTIGIANMSGENGTATDQRGNKRLGSPDIGAVEISSLVYDANGGNFTLPELTEYDGKTYYEGENPKQYAKVDHPGAEYTVLDGKTKLKPTRKGYSFLGWSEKPKLNSMNPTYKPGTKHTINDQKVLYAVWKNEAISLEYFSNGKTSGTIPIQNKVLPNTSITIKTQGKLKRKGYKFSGWSTKPSAKKGEAAYAPGKKLKLVKNTKLYAIWKR